MPTVCRFAGRSIFVGLFVVAGCESPISYRPAEDHSSVPTATPLPGPCVDGKRYSCSITLGQHDGVVDCMEGYRVCVGGVLGECIPEGSAIAMSLDDLRVDGDAPDLSVRSLGSSTTCASNPCDPYCRTYVDTPAGALDGGCGLTYDDAGGIPASSCGTGQLLCGALCKTTKTDPDNCGACGNVCGAGQACSAGTCASTCQAPLTKCGRSCVDVTVDNGNCGACGTVCATGKGCSAGACTTTVSVGAAPPKCVNAGPPIQIASTSGPIDCAGNLAQTTFQNAVCTCSDFATSITAGSVTTDGFDSRLGPYAPGGLGAGLGTNGQVLNYGNMNVGGNLTIGGVSGYNGSSGTLSVKQDLKCNGPFSYALTTGTVAGNAYVNGNASLLFAALNVFGNYYAPVPATTPPTSQISGSIVRGPVSVAPPCPCGTTDVVPAAAIVAAHVTNNDNALIGLAPNAVATGGRLDLPCGNYYLSSIGSTFANATIVTHGNTALYIGGDISATLGSMEIEPDPTSNLDVFVTGSISMLGGTLRFGNPNYPGQMRLYFGGSSILVFPGATVYLAANVDGPAATFTSAIGDTTFYGSLYANTVNMIAGTLTVHHDRSVHEAGASCEVPLAPATFSRVFEATCGPGERARWGFFTYATADPPGTNVTFAAKTAGTVAALATASSTALAVAGYQPVGSTTAADPSTCDGACAIDLSTKLAPSGLSYLRLDATLNPSKALSPTLKAWNVTYRCTPSE